jgi:Nuclease-related domain
MRTRLAVVLAVLTPVAIPVWVFAPQGSFVAGVVVGALFGMAVWIWDQPPNFIENWRQGRDGERATAKELRTLRSEGWSVRHDLEDKYGNLDHVVVGPGGVFLLDTKNP